MGVVKVIRVVSWLAMVTVVMVVWVVMVVRVVGVVMVVRVVHQHGVEVFSTVHSSKVSVDNNQGQVNAAKNRLYLIEKVKTSFFCAKLSRAAKLLWMHLRCPYPIIALWVKGD